ncbi:MAG TPA: hypothetical protein VKR80_02530, partial [Candidatus Limnocylindria bacterium]|nr:hypothetical protein [Candidatus Limnocylindria bacterium]
MTALQLVQVANDVLFAALFVLVAINAARQRTRTALDTVLLFGALAYALLQGPVLQLIGVPANPVATFIVLVIVLALPYLMLRLLADFSDVPLLVRAATAGGLIASVVVAATSGTPLDPIVTLLIVAYFGGVALYTA